jgi:DNA polymerase
MLACACEDGRARYLLQYQGAATTGRWAGRLIQPQNLPQGSLGADDEDLISAIKTRDADLVELMYGDAAQAVSDALRPMMMAEDGHEIVAGDFSAIEARVVLALAEQWDKVKVLKDGQDVYCDMAETIFGLTKGSTSKKTHPNERHVGKAAVLGLGFQCGASTFHEMFCPEQTLPFCEEVVQTYRRSWAPNVPALWEGLEAAAVDACFNNRRREYAGIVYEMEDEWLTARLPSGRKLYYHGAHCALRPMPWDPEDRRLGLFYYAFKYGQWRKVGTYGGHLTENVVQAVARDLMANAMLAADNHGIPIILTVHDEVVGETKRGTVDAQDFEEIMVGSQPQWVSDCGIPVAAEAWVGERYRK